MTDERVTRLSGVASRSLSRSFGPSVVGKTRAKASSGASAYGPHTQGGAGGLRSPRPFPGWGKA